MLSLLDHTRVGFPYLPKRENCGRGDPRADQRPHGRVRDLHRQYDAGDAGDAAVNARMEVYLGEHLHFIIF